MLAIGLTRYVNTVEDVGVVSRKSECWICTQSAILVWAQSERFDYYSAYAHPDYGWLSCCTFVTPFLHDCVTHVAIGWVMYASVNTRITIGWVIYASFNTHVTSSNT